MDELHTILRLGALGALVVALGAASLVAASCSDLNVSRPDSEASEPIDVVFVGDSVTEAAYMDVPAFGGEGRENAYANLLVASLPATYTRIPWGTLTNIGLGATTVYDWNAWVGSRIAVHSPEIVTIMLGINDQRWDHVDATNAATGYETASVTLFMETMQAFIDAIRQLPTRPEVVLLTPTELKDDTDPISKQSELDEYVEAIRELSASNPDVSIIDVHAGVPMQPADYISADTLHPNASGHRKVADYVAPLLAETAR